MQASLGTANRKLVNDGLRIKLSGGAMRKLIIVYVILAVIVVSAFAQEKPPSSPQPKPSSDNTQTQANPSRQAEIDRQREAQLELKRQQSYSRLQNLGSDNPRLPTRVRIYRDVISQYYRKPDKKELRAVQPDQRDFQKFAAFLRKKNTGIFRLMPDVGCSPNTKVLVVSPECVKYSMPGGGSSFSFRAKTYRIPHLADLTFYGENLVVKGVLLEAILVSLGDSPIEQVSLNTRGVGFLRSRKPSKTVDDAYEFANNLRSGFIRDGFAYGRGIIAKENITFVMRSVAYRGKWLSAAAGVTYNEFDFDKRRDVIVAFRIIRKDRDGSVTILWKQLRNIRSPKLEIEEDEEITMDLPRN